MVGFFCQNQPTQASGGKFVTLNPNPWAEIFCHVTFSRKQSLNIKKRLISICTHSLELNWDSRIWKYVSVQEIFVLVRNLKGKILCHVKFPIKFPKNITFAIFAFAVGNNFSVNHKFAVVEHSISSNFLRKLISKVRELCDNLTWWNIFCLRFRNQHKFFQRIRV